MRADYSLIHSLDDDEGPASSDRKGENSDSVGDSINGMGSMDTKLDMPLQFDYGPDFTNLLGSSARNDKRYSNWDFRFVMKLSCQLDILSSYQSSLHVSLGTESWQACIK